MPNQQFPFYPRVTKRNFRKWNEEMFKKYNNERVYHHPNPFIRFVERKRVEAILGGLDPLGPQDNILAAGCGEGFIEGQISTGKITMVDISSEAIKRAKANLASRKNVKFLRADLEKLPFKKCQFDKIECSEVIEHVLSSQALLSELDRVVKPDGVMVITFPNERLINSLKMFFIRLGIFNTIFPNVPRDMTEEWHLRPYSINSFRKDAAVRWQIITVRGIPYSWLPIRYMVKCKLKT